MTQNEEQIPEIAQDALDADIPHVYANNFRSALTTSDVFLILMRDGRPKATLNLSYTVAKSLAKSLSDTIEVLEKATGHSIMTIVDVDAGMSKPVKADET